MSHHSERQKSVSGAPRRRRPRRRRGLVPAIAIAASLAAVGILAGCGSTGFVGAKGDISHGKDLFVQKCGPCHTLADAGTQGTIGPNLDDAFRYDRQEGFHDSSIRQVVRGQIAYPVSTPNGEISVNGQEQRPQGMPADLVTGTDADDVAAYVASVAGTQTGTGTSAATTAAPPPSPPPPAASTASSTAEATTAAPPASTPTPAGGGAAEVTAGKQVFETAGCKTCHTLKDAGATGTVGPNLDEAKPPKSLVVDRVTNGKGVMPSFKGELSDQQIDAVATYVSTVAGK